MKKEESTAESVKKKYEHFPLWQCDLKSMDQDGPLNVGSKMEMSCRGDFIDLPQMDRVKIEFDESKNQYMLQLLNIKTFDYKNAQFVVTSYQAGKHSPVNFVVTDKVKGFRVEGMEWTIESVLDPTKKQEPYPSWGPFGMKMPMWFWGAILFIVLLFGYFLFRKAKQFFERRRLVEKLYTHGTALTPFNQFNKDLRFLVRGYQNKSFDEKYAKEFSQSSYVEQLEKLFRQFLMRELLVPTFDWSDSQILKEIKRCHRKIYQNIGPDIIRALKELERARNSGENLENSDRDQLTNMCRKIGEDIFQLRKVKK